MSPAGRAVAWQRPFICPGGFGLAWASADDMLAFAADILPGGGHGVRATIAGIKTTRLAAVGCAGIGILLLTGILLWQQRPRITGATAEERVACVHRIADEKPWGAAAVLAEAGERGAAGSHHRSPRPKVSDDPSGVAECPSISLRAL